MGQGHARLQQRCYCTQKNVMESGKNGLMSWEAVVVSGPGQLPESQQDNKKKRLSGGGTTAQQETIRWGTESVRGVLGRPGGERKPGNNMRGVHTQRRKESEDLQPLCPPPVAPEPWKTNGEWTSENSRAENYFGWSAGPGKILCMDMTLNPVGRLALDSNTKEQETG